MNIARKIERGRGKEKGRETEAEKAKAREKERCDRFNVASLRGRYYQLVISRTVIDP